MGIHVCGWLLVIVGVDICGWLVVIVGGHVVSCVHSSWSWAFVFVGSHWLLLEVIFVGGHHHLLLLCIHGGQGQSLLFIVCVDGGGKEKGSHVTHCDNGIMFELPHEINCK